MLKVSGCHEIEMQFQGRKKNSILIFKEELDSYHLKMDSNRCYITVVLCYIGHILKMI